MSLVEGVGSLISMAGCQKACCWLWNIATSLSKAIPKVLSRKEEMGMPYLRMRRSTLPIMPGVCSVPSAVRAPNSTRRTIGLLAPQNFCRGGFLWPILPKFPVP